MRMDFGEGFEGDRTGVTGAAGAMGVHGAGTCPR